MLNMTVIALGAGLIALFAAPREASAQDAIAAPAHKTIGQPAKSSMIPSLAVINSRAATLQGNVLTMTDVGSNSIVFADRPFRAAGHVLTKHFIKEWDEGSDSFAKDPPNATISVLSAEGDTVEDAVVSSEIAKAGRRQADLRGDRARREPVQGDRTSFAVHRLVRRARLRRSRIRRRRRRMAWRLVRPSRRGRRGRRRGWARSCGDRSGGCGRLLSSLCLSILRAAAPPACGYYPYPPCY